MTVKLLKPYGWRPAGAITGTLDASTEAALIAAGKATADLTGGTRYFQKKPGVVVQPKVVAVGAISLKMEEQATCELPEGQVLKITGGAGAVGEATRAGSTDKWVIGAGALPPIGPFSGTQRIPITCTAGGIDAVVGDAVLGIAQVAARANTLATCGNSRMAQWWLPGLNYTQNQGHMSWGMVLSGHKFKAIGNFAVGGSGVTADLNGRKLSLQLDDAINSGAKFIAVDGVVNDIGAGVAISAIQSEYLSCIKKVVDAGRTFIAFTDYPIHSVGSSYTAAKNGQIMQWNAWLLDVCSTVAGVIVADVGGAMINPVSVTASPYDVIPDGSGLHNGNTAAYYGGKAFAAAVSSVPSVDRLVRSAADYKGFSPNATNNFNNPLFLNPTSGLAAGMTTAAANGASIVPSTEARADGYGNNQVGTVTFAATASSVARLIGPDMKATIANGDTLQFIAEVDVSALTNCLCVKGYLRLTSSGIGAGGIITEITCLQYNQGNDHPIPEAYKGVYMTTPYKYDSAVLGPLTEAVFILAAYGGKDASGSLAAGGVTMKIARASVRTLA